MEVPAGLKYTETHEWIKREGDEVICGITDYAQSELSDVVFVELPEIGKEVKKGETLCVVESVKAASDIYAPISGKVVAVNQDLEGNPEFINSSPYEKGWICKLDISQGSDDESSLLNDESYRLQIVN